MIARNEKKHASKVDIQEVNPYTDFLFEEYNYIFKTNVKWQKSGSGNYQADSFTNQYEIRGAFGNCPAICLPGGPGSALTSKYKRYFDKNKFRVITSDWRGVGMSMPSAQLEDNSTDRLVDDIEKIRKILGAEKVLLRGSSWAATMALAYAQQYPQNVSGLVLGKPLLASEEDTEWNYGSQGIALEFQDEYADFSSFTGKADTREILETYASLLNGNDEKEACKAYVEWTKWEWVRSGESFPMKAKDIDTKHPGYFKQLSRAKIMSHYAENNFFISQRGILTNPESIIDIPTIIATNEKDPLCAPDNLSLLKRDMPNAEFIIKEGAGYHTVFSAKNLTSKKNNDFIDNAYAYGVEKVRQINAGADIKLNIDG